MKPIKVSATRWVAFFLFLFISSFVANTVFAQNTSANEVRLKGKIENYVIDRIDGKHEMKTFILDSVSKRRVELRNIKASERDLLSDKIVSIKGRKTGADQVDVLGVEYDGSTSSGTSSGGEFPNALGTQKVLVYLVNFQDKPNEKPWSLAQVQDFVFSQVNAFFLENSVNRTSLAGNVVGWYTLPIDSTSCNGFDIQNYSKSAATSAGVDVSQYTRHVFLFAGNSACGYSGMAQVAAMPSSAWINGSLTIRTIAHELLHNLGSWHSRALKCTGASLLGPVTDCVKQEYGNTVDIMGYSGTVGHTSAYQKQVLGWLSSSEVLEVSASGEYALTPLSVASGQVRALKIYRGLDAVTGLKQWFFVEQRKPINFDSMLTDRGVIDVNNIFNGAAITLVQGTREGYLLDMTPGSTFVDMKDAALLPGATFTDSVSGVSIKTISSDNSQVVVQVQIGSVAPPPPPPPPPPADTTAPSVSISSPANGATVSGAVSIAAQAGDDIAVSKVEFYVDGVLKGNDVSAPYSLSWDTTKVANGSHVILAKAYDSSNNTQSAQISVNVNNVTGDTTAPIVAITSPADGSVFSPRTSISIQASASDNVAIARVDFYVDGNLVCSDSSASYTCSYKLGGAKGVSYMIEAIAYDKSGNMAKYGIMIQSSGAGGGSGGGGGKGKR